MHLCIMLTYSHMANLANCAHQRFQRAAFSETADFDLTTREGRTIALWATRGADLFNCYRSGPLFDVD
jgi:hypothetical protein